jgi:hypothetical protein
MDEQMKNGVLNFFFPYLSKIDVTSGTGKIRNTNGTNFIISHDIVSVSGAYNLRMHGLWSVPRQDVWGVSIVEKKLTTAILLVHAKDRGTLYIEGVRFKCVKPILDVLGIWGKTKPTGSYTEIVNHYLKMGYEIVHRDEQGTQLSKDGVNYWQPSTNDISIPKLTPEYLKPLVNGTSVINRRHTVVVNSDGTIIMRETNS